MAEFKLGRLRFVWKGPWLTGTDYVKDDVVKYGGTTYVCKSAHSANASFNVDLIATPTARWEVMTGGTEWKTAPWATSTQYKINDLVKYGGNVYICTANHGSNFTANGGFYLDEAANKWNLFVSGNEWKGNWAPSSYYKKNDLVKYNGLTYVCLSGHSSVVGSYVGETVVDVNIVQVGTQYTSDAQITFSDPQLPDGVTATGHITVNGFGGIASVIIDNVGSGYTAIPTITVDPEAGDGTALLVAVLSQSFVNGLESDQEKWQVFSEGFQWRGLWNGSDVVENRVATSYAKNDVVKFGAGLYLCTIPHTSNRTAFIEANWTVFVEGLQFEDSWDGATEYQTGDVVTYGGYAYVAVDRNTSQIPPASASHWNLLTTGFNNRSRYISAQSYKVGDLVQYGGNTYVAIEEILPNETPYYVTSKWEKITDGFRWRGEWEDAPTEVTYKVGDVAKYRASTYICVAEHVPSEIDTTVTASAVISGNKITLNSTAQLNKNQVIIFSGVSFGGITANTPFYVKEVPDSAHITISATLDGDVKTLSVSTGVMTGTFNARPDQDTGTFWNSFAEGDANNVLTRRGDLVTRNAIQNVKLAKGADGTFLKAGAKDLEWGRVGQVTRVFYVSTDGIDSPERGTTLNDTWRTIKYACNHVRTIVVPTVDQPAVINVKTGVYTEEFPISVPKFTSLVGDELRMSIIQPTTATSGNNKFYMRDSTTMRNFTFRGATGANLPNGTTDTYTVVNQYGTKRPTGGAWVSLDPGTGPNDESVWVGARSPYMQNITLFGDYCIGQKIDGSLHNGGNRSLTSNDFTTILSNGIGAWAVGDGRAELVSVFTYYSYIGYLCESGGVLRATNGNNSYGSYGSVSEGVNPTEISRTSNVDNRRLEAIVDRVQTDGAEKVLYLEYDNAGETYSTADYGFSGSGVFNSVVATPVIKNGAIAEVRVLTAGENYTSVTNNAQAGTDIDIRLGAADIALTNAYVGERILVTDGAGSGQYAYITSFDGGSKLATLGMETFTPLVLSATTSSTNVLTTIDTSTLTVDMPFTLTGTAFGNLATGLQYYVKAITAGGTISSVSITGFAGQLTVTSGTYIVGQKLTISGTKGGTGSITGYADPTTYYIMVGGTSVTSIQITDTYENAIAGVANLTTAGGTPTGWTYTLGSTKFTAYTDTGTKAAVTLATDAGTMQLHKSGWDTIITGITESFNAASKTNPVSITTTVPHAYFSGMEVVISGVVGMTQLNGNSYYVDKTGASTFTLYTDYALTNTVDGTGYTTYISGGTGVGKQHVLEFLNTTTRYVVEPRVVVSTGTGARATAIQSQGINTIDVDTGGGGFTIPPKVIISGDGTDTGGFGAVATSTIVGGVEAVVIQQRGGSYISAPSLTFVGGGLPNNSPNHAQASTTITKSIKTIQLTAGGTGYSTPPTVSANNTGGSGAIISAQISNVVGGVAMSGGSNSQGVGYTSPPTVEFVGGEPLQFARGTAILSAEVTTITVQQGGSGYDPDTTNISFSAIGGFSSAAVAHAIIDFGNYVAGTTPGVITSIEVDTNGAGYSVAPGVVISGAGVDASATANINGVVTGINITSPGRGYKTIPTVSITGGGGAGARGTVSLTGSVYSVTIVDGGRGFTGTPNLTFAGGGGLNAAANVVAMDNVLDTVSILSAGSGYTSNPAISVSGGSLVYDQAKCARDVGYMVDAVTADMVFNSNYQATTAGVSYLRSYSSVVLNTQKAETIAGINQAKTLALAKTTNTTAQTRINSLFTIIADIVDNGLSSVPTLVYTHPGNTPTGITGGSDILITNTSFIQAEITAWIALQIAGGTGIWSGFTYNAATAVKVDYVVQALAYDLMYGGNSQTIGIASSYYDPDGVLVLDGPQNAATIGRLQEILSDIVQNIAIAKSSGNSSSQNISETPVGSAGAGTILEDLSQIIIDVITSGTDSAPAVVEPTYINGDTELAAVRTVIRADIVSIKNGVISYLTDNFVGRGILVRARINGVVQQVTVSDPGGRFSTTPLVTFTAGNEFKSAVAGARYYSNASSRIAIGLAQLTQTLAGIDYTRVVARAIAQNAAPSTIYQSSINRITGTAGPAGIQNAVDVWVRAVYYTIQNGENFVNAPEMIRINREFLRNEAMEFWSANYPGIATATWSRDVGLMLDAIATDLADQGVQHTLTSGIKATFQGTARTTNLAAATAGIDFVRDNVLNLIQNIIIANPLTGFAITETTGTTNLITTADTDLLTIGEPILFTGTQFGGLLPNTMYYVTSIPDGTTFTVSLTLGGADAVLTSQTGSMILSKQYTQATLSLENNALTAVPNLFNYTKNIISTVVANSATFAGVATLLDNNKAFIKAEVIAYINTTYADFDYNQSLCARDVGFIVDALTYDLRNAVDSAPAVTSATTGVVSSITVNSAGTGYGAGTSVVISGGTPSTPATAVPVYNTLTGAITGFNITNKGRGYGAVPTVTIVPDSGTGALVRAKIVGGLINKMTVINPGSGYSAGPSLTLVDVNNTSDATLLVRTANGVLGQPRFTSRGVGFTTADCLVNGDGYADIAQIGQYVYVNNLTNIPTPGANIQFESSTSQYYKLVTIRDVQGPTGIIGARQLILDNKEFIQYEIISYLNSFAYDSIKCSRDVGLIVSALADDFTYNSNSRLQAVLYQHQRGTFALFEQQRMQTAFALEELQSKINVLFDEDPLSSFSVSRKLDFLVEWIKNKENYSTIPGFVMADGNFRTQDDRAKNVMLANVDFIKAQTIAWMINNTKINGFTQTIFANEIRQIVRSIAYDVTYTGNSQTVEFASSYYINDELTIPGVPGTSAAAKTDFLAMLTYLNTLMQDVAINNNVTPQAGNSVTQNIMLTPGDSTSQGRINTLMGNFTSIVTSGFASSGVTLGASSFTGFTITRRTELLSAKATLQSDIITWMNETFVDFTYNTSTCFRDVGLIVQAVADDIYGDVAKTVEAGQRYYAATAALVLSDQKPQTIAAVQQINYIIQLLITNQTYTRTQTNAFQVRYPAITTGADASVHVEETIRIIRRIIENGTVFNGIKQLLLDNKEYVKAEVVSYVSASYENLDYSIDLCARDVGLIIDAIAYDVYGGLSRSREAGLRYYQSASALKAIGGVDHSGDQYGPTVSAMAYLNDVLQAILIDSEPAIKFQETIPRISGASIVYDASRLLIGTKVASCINTILEVINGGPSVLPAGRYTARLQVSPPLTVTTTPAHNTAMVIRSKYSQVRLTGHDFLNIGTGSKNDTNYPGIPLNAPDQGKEITEVGGGRVFYTSTDQDGNFRVGSLFKVEQSTGIATLNADAFNLSGLNELTLGGVSLGSGGATVNEFSTDGTFFANSDKIVPTQKAIKTYIQAALGSGGGNIAVNAVTAGDVFITGREIDTVGGGLLTFLSADGLSVASVLPSSSSVTGAVVIAGGVGIAQNLNVGGTASITGNLTVSSTGYVQLATGTTPQRPGTVSPGMARFNTTTAQFEGYNGSQWAALGGGNPWAIKTTNYTAVNGDRLVINTSASAVTVTLPASPALGDTVRFIDGTSTFDINSLIINRNSQPIMGDTSDMTVNTRNAGFSLVYFNSTYGWRLGEA